MSLRVSRRLFLWASGMPSICRTRLLKRVRLLSVIGGTFGKRTIHLRAAILFKVMILPLVRVIGLTIVRLRLGAFFITMKRERITLCCLMLLGGAGSFQS